MPSFNVEVPNPLSKEEAGEKLKSLMDAVREKYKGQISDVQENWTDEGLEFSFKSFGFTISGKSTVDDESVKVDGSLPIAAMAFRGQIERSISDEIKKILGAA